MQLLWNECGPWPHVMQQSRNAYILSLLLREVEMASKKVCQMVRPRDYVQKEYDWLQDRQG